MEIFCLESGEILKQKWHKKTKNSMLKLENIYIIRSQHSLSFSSIWRSFSDLWLYNLGFKKWLLNFALSKKVKKN